MHHQPDQPTPAAPHGESLPYGTPAAPRVAVRGEARLDVDPEIARLGITVGARGTDRRTALADLTRRNTQALDLVKSYAEAVEKLSTGTFSLTPQLAKGRNEKIRTYHGRVHITATIADFTVLGELTTRLADLELTSVDGPWWNLRPASAAHRDARTQAVREAVQRAREYAEALGARLVSLVELADIGAETAPPVAAMSRAGAYGGAPAAPGGPPALDLEPQRQTVYACVTARFTMTPPQL
jgi:uncharacterized protein